MHGDRKRPLYGISVAADLTGVAPQSLRVYEAKGLLEPSRTEGGTRRYSGDDIDRVHQISALLKAGLNLAGIAHVLEMQTELRRLRRELDRLRRQGEGGASRSGP